MLKWTIAFILAASPHLTKAQTAAPAETTKAAESKAFYEMLFVVREVKDEKVVNTRTYSTIASTYGRGSSLRAGEKVPYASGEGATTNWQMIDVGVGIDCGNLELVGDRLSLRVAATVDSIAPTEDKNARRPVIRNNRWDGLVIVPLKHPTIIFSSDDPFSSQKMQLQLTVTPLH
jgi:hypothetical protein